MLSHLASIEEVPVHQYCQICRAKVSETQEKYRCGALGHSMKAHIKSYYVEYPEEMGVSDLRETSVLDVSTGNGAFSMFVASLGAERVVSLDLDLSGERKGRFEVLVKKSRKHD